MKTIDFDIEKAKSGNYYIVTRDEQDVTILDYNDDCEDGKPIVGYAQYMEQPIIRWKPDGTISDEPHRLDLFLVIDDRKEINIPFNEEGEWELTSDAMERAKNEKQEPKPKFKVGDRVKRKVADPHNPATEYIYTVFEIENGKYCLDHDDHESWIPISAQDEFELVNEPKREHKFILGDIVVRAKHGVYGDRYFIQRIDDDCYIAYPYGVGGDLSNREHKIWYNEEDEWELFSDAVRLSTEPEKFECTVSLEQINTDIDEIWKNTLVNMINNITKRNTASFMQIIDETLRYMDCDAFVDDARVGMRQFVKELKKRLTV